MNASILNQVVSCACLCLCLLSDGCGASDAPERRPVKGIVKYAGDPLDAAEIRFIPESGPVSLATIRAGIYQLDNKGGVPLGNCKVQIVSSTPQLDESVAPGDVGTSGEQIPEVTEIPAKYNSQTTLTATIEKGEGAQTLDFELEK
ncbi:MAG: hypothetical protein RLO18_02795 [Gimesia chilikensis]